MIKLIVSNTSISSSDRGSLVEGNINSSFVSFTFSPEWSNLARVAVFTNGDTSVCTSLSSDICAIPHEVLTAPGALYVSLRGVGDGGHFVLCTENEFLGNVLGSNSHSSVIQLENITPNVIDSMLADIAELKENGGSAAADGKSAYEIAVENGFEGTVTEWLASLKGLDGIDGDDGYSPVKGVDYFTAADISEIASAVDLSSYATSASVDAAIQAAIGDAIGGSY